VVDNTDQLRNETKDLGNKVDGLLILSSDLNTLL